MTATPTVVYSAQQNAEKWLGYAHENDSLVCVAQSDGMEDALRQCREKHGAGSTDCMGWRMNNGGKLVKA